MPCVPTPRRLTPMEGRTPPAQTFRYLAFVLVRNGRALFYKLVPSSDQRVQGSFTAHAMRRVLDDVLEELAEKGVVINAVVADNAANMQAIRNTPCVVGI